MKKRFLCCLMEKNKRTSKYKKEFKSRLKLSTKFTGKTKKLFLNVAVTPKDAFEEEKKYHPLHNTQQRHHLSVQFPPPHPSSFPSHFSFFLPPPLPPSPISLSFLFVYFFATLGFGLASLGPI